MNNKNVEVLSITAFIILVALCSWLYLLPIHLKSLGANDRVIGIAYSLFALGFTISQMFGGYLADRLGRRKMIAIPGYIAAPLYLVMALTYDLKITIIAYLIINLMSSLQMPSFIPLIAESSDNKESSISFFNTLASMGVGVGTLVGALLVKSLGIRSLMIICAFLVLISAALRHIFIKETKDIKTHKPSFKFRLNKEIIFFIIVGCFIALTMSLTINGPLVTLHLQEYMGKTKEQINLLYAYGWIIAALSSFIAGKLAEKYKAKLVLGASVMIHTIFLILFLTIKNTFYPVIVFLLISFAMFQFMMITQSLVVTSLTNERNRGRITGLFGTITGIVASLGPTIGTELKNSLGSLTPFYLAFGLSFIVFALLFKVKNFQCDILKKR